MKQWVGKFKVAIISLLAMILCATAFAFVGIKLQAYADEEALPMEQGVAIVEDEDGSKGYFNLSGTTFSGFTDKLYKLLGAEQSLVNNICVPFKLKVPKKVTNFSMSLGTSYLKGIEFPYDGNLTTIADWKFTKTEIEDLLIPVAVKSWGVATFLCPKLKTIQFIDNGGQIQTTNGTYTTVNGGEAVLSDGGATLYWGSAAAASKLATDAAYSNVTKLNTRAFSVREGIDSVVIPEKITSIDATTFAASPIKTITGEGNNSVFTIENNSIIQKSNNTLIFAGSGETGELTIPEGVKSIGGGALENDGITILHIPASLETITGCAWQAAGRTTLTVADGNTHFYSKNAAGEDLNCLIAVGTGGKGDVLQIGTASTDFSKLPESVYKIGIQAFCYCDIKDVNIPEHITEIDAQAFVYSGITSLKIHDNLIFNGDSHFSNTPYYLNPKNWDSGQAFYIDDMLFKLVTTFSGEYTVRKGTTSIFGGALKDCVQLTKVTFPDTLKRINNLVFENCSMLTGMVLPNSLEYISERSFNNCTNLTQITLPNNTATTYVAGTFIGYNGKIIAPNYAVYQAVEKQITTNRANLTYEVPVKVQVGTTTVNLTKLAGFALSYAKGSNGLWADSGSLSLGGVSTSGVDHWTVNGERKATLEEVKSYVIAKGATEISIIAYTAQDDTNIPVTLDKPATGQSASVDFNETIDAETLFNGYSRDTMKLTYKGTGATIYTESEQAPRNAGSYTVTVYPKAGEWTESGSDPVEIGTLTINPKTVTVVWVGVGENEDDFEYVYDGKEHLPSAYFEDENYDKIWLADYITLQASGNAVNAQSYTAVLNYTGNANYTLSGAIEKAFTIAKREIVVTWDETTEFDFTGYEVIPSVEWTTDYYDGVVSVSYALAAKQDGNSALTNGKAINAGSYVITLTVTGSDNYEIKADSLSFEFTIKEPESSVVYWEDFTFEYDGTAHTPKAYYYKPEQPTEKVYLEEGITVVGGAAYNAGTYTARLSQWVLSTLGLTADSLECEFEITKKKVTVVWDSETLSFVYNGKQQKPVAYFEGVDGVKYLLELSLSGGAVDAGTYTATVNDYANFTNYEIDADVSEMSKQFTIEKKVVTAVWNGSEFVYDGTAQSASFTIAGYNGGYTVEYFTLSGEKLEGKPVEAGTYVAVVTLTDSNYQLKNASFTYNIIHSDLDIVDANGGINWLVIGLIIGICSAITIGMIALCVATAKRKLFVVAGDDGNDDEDGFYEQYRE